MGTGNKKSNIYLKKFLTQDQITNNFMDYLHFLIKESHMKLVSQSGVYTYPVTGISTAPDTIDFLTPGEATVGDGNGPDLQADDGHGAILDLDESLRAQVPVPNILGETYHCGIRFNWLPYDTEINVRTGAIKWALFEEAIGELADPNNVSYYASTMQVQVDSVCNGVLQVGRTVRVWMNIPVSTASGQTYEDCVITAQNIPFQHDGGANYFDVPNELRGYFINGQTITIDDSDSSEQVTTVGIVGAEDSGGAGFTRITTAHDLSDYTVAQNAFVLTGNNIITLTGTLGQTTNPSLIASDYKLFLKGITVTTTDLRNNEYYSYLYNFMGTGAGNNPTGFDHTDQREIVSSMSGTIVTIEDFMKLQIEKNGIILRGGGQVKFASGTLTWANNFEIFNPFRGVYSIPAGSISGIANNNVLYTEIYQRQIVTTGGNASGEIYVGSVSDFNDNDKVIIGDSDSNQITGYVFGAPVGSKLVIDDGAGTPLDLTNFTVAKGAWVQRTNLSITKEVMNQGVLRPTSDNIISQHIMVIAIRHGDIMIFRDGVLRLENGDVGEISNLPSGFNWVNNLIELNDSISKVEDNGVAIIAPATYTETSEVQFNKNLSWVGVTDKTIIEGSLATNIIKILPDPSTAETYQNIQLRNLHIKNNGAGNVLEIDNIGATKGIVVNIDGCQFESASALSIKVTKTVAGQYVKVNITGSKGKPWLGNIDFQSNHNDDELRINGVRFSTTNKIIFGMAGQNPTSKMFLRETDIDQIELLGAGQLKTVITKDCYPVTDPTQPITVTNKGVNGLHTDLANRYAIANDTRLKAVIPSIPDKTIRIWPSKKFSDGREIYTFIEAQFSSKFPRVSYTTGDYDGGSNHDQLTTISFSDPVAGVVTVTTTGPTFGVQTIGTFNVVGGGDNFTPVAIFINSDDSISLVSGLNFASLALASHDDNLPLGGASQFKVCCVIHEVDSGNTTTQTITTSHLIDRRAFGGAGGGGTGDANSFLEDLKSRIRRTFFKFFTPNIFSSQKEIETDSGNTTALYDIPNSLYKFATGEILQTINQLGGRFLGTLGTWDEADQDLAQCEIHLLYNLGAVDPNPTVEVSRDGGNEFQTIEMTRIGESNKFTGVHTFDEEAVNQTLKEYALVNADTQVSFTDTGAGTKLALKMEVTDKMVHKTIDLYLNKLGSAQGALFVDVYKDDGGLPSTSVADRLGGTELIDIASLSTGDITETLDLSTIVTRPGNYWIIIETDQTYKNNYSVGVDELRWRADGPTSAPTDQESATFNGTTWSLITDTAFVYKTQGRTVDLRIKITSSADDVELLGMGTFYGKSRGQTVSGALNRYVSIFSGDDNIYQFSIPVGKFLPNHDLLKVYHVETGATYVYPAFEISGQNINFKTGDFYLPSENVTLIFDQSNGSAFDNSDLNRNLLAANHLGSTDPSNDLSLEGRGPVVKTDNSIQIEMTINDALNLVLKNPLTANILQLIANNPTNVIGNGDFAIKQRGLYTTPAHGNWIADRWNFIGTTGFDISYTDMDLPENSNCHSSISLIVTSATPAPAGGAYSLIRQPIEGQYAKRVYGSKMTFGIWVKTNVAGKYGVTIKNSSITRGRVDEIEILASEVGQWVEKFFTVDHSTEDQSIWPIDNTLGMYVNLLLMSGGDDDFSAVGQWLGEDKLSTPNQVNFLGTIGNYIKITGVRIYQGDGPAPFRHLAGNAIKELIHCQRYYRKSAPSGVYMPGSLTGAECVSVGSNSITALMSYMKVTFNPVMRSTPVIRVFALDGTQDAVTGGGGSGNLGANTGLTTPSNSGFRVWSNASATTVYYTIFFNWDADAEL